jgi:hypothetical protein
VRTSDEHAHKLMRTAQSRVTSGKYNWSAFSQKNKTVITFVRTVHEPDFLSSSQTREAKCHSISRQLYKTAALGPEDLLGNRITPRDTKAVLKLAFGREIYPRNSTLCLGRRSQWRRGLRHEMSSPARTLGS